MNDRYSLSRSLFSRAQRLIAGGVSSQIRRLEQPVPLFFSRAEGSRMWDVDGNEYIDYQMGMGPNLFGHAPRFITDRVARDMRSGYVFTGQTAQELAVTEMVLKAIPLEGIVRYATSGTEICQLALRLARAYTKRPKYIKFEGHYHGWADSVLQSVHPSVDQAGPDNCPIPSGGSSGIAPGAYQDVVIAPWNDLSNLEKIFNKHPNEIACVFMEPILANTNCIYPRAGYLEGVKNLCRQRGALLIFDEVITGFRVALGGAQELTGVVPDLATYAKALAGGFPIAMLVGRTEIMKLIGDGTVYHGGSFNTNVMSMSAARASLEHIMGQGSQFYIDLNGYGQQLMNGLSEAAGLAQSNLHVQGVGAVFATSFTTEENISDYRQHARHCDDEKHARFATEMLNRGIRISPGGRWHMSSSHTAKDIEQTLDTTVDALRFIEKYPSN